MDRDAKFRPHLHPRRRLQLIGPPTYGGLTVQGLPISNRLTGHCRRSISTGVRLCGRCHMATRRDNVRNIRRFKGLNIPKTGQPARLALGLMVTKNTGRHR